ncbi:MULTISPECIES: TIGR02452 family protein [unclassified Collinsella]|uniref:TIGR02452 family protein n=1 Tax=unclassified Collinsella TaxID=2637548 RepID=UPI00319DEF56
MPKVRFERERFHSYADVIVAAAPNLKRAKVNYHVLESDLARSMRSRIRLVLGIADVLGHDKLVLGAFGCGVFGWDALRVAQIFAEELATGKHVASQVTFAVPKGRRDENLEMFQHVFATFPEVNEEPYAPAPEPAPVSRNEGEAEDDWRKYL